MKKCRVKSSVEKVKSSVERIKSGVDKNENTLEDICYMTFKDYATGEEYKGYWTKGENQDGNIMVVTIFDNDGEGAKVELSKKNSAFENYQKT